MRRQPGKGYSGSDDGYAVVYERYDGIAASGEEATETEMDTGEDAVPHISTQIVAALSQHLRIVGEYTHGKFGNKL